MRSDNYRDFLVNDFNRRKELNASYSLRAYARDLGLSSSRLSQILKNKQGLSLKSAGEVSVKLRLNAEERNWFCSSVGALHSRNQKERNDFKILVNDLKRAVPTYSELQMDYFKVIASWHHYAVLELTYLSDFQNNYNWIASKLGITSIEVVDVIERLKRLELIEEVDGTLKDVFKFLASPSDVPHSSIKNFNVQLMKKAMADLYEQDVLNREYSSNIFAFNKEDLPKVKEKIRSFRRELEIDASRNPIKNSVYALNIQFHELTK